MNKILNFTAVAAAPAERLACGLLDSHCDNGLAVARTVYDEIKALHADMYFYVKGGTLGALCVRMNNDAQQIVELTRELDKERAKNQNQLLQLDRQARELVEIKDKNEELKNIYSIASVDRTDLEARNKEITERLSAWVLWAGRVLGHEEANDELQRDAIDRLHDRAGNNLRGVREHRDELLQQLANVNLELNNYKQLVEAMKAGTTVDQSTIKHHAEHICRLSEEAEELKEDRALASGQLENWRAMARSILDLCFRCYPVSHIGDKELRDLLVSEVGRMRGERDNVIQLNRNAAEEIKHSNDELKRWQQWALVQFGLHGADQDIREGIDSFLCSGITDREALRLDLDSVKRHLDHATKQREDILKYRDQFVMDIRNVFKDRLGFDAGCGYKAIAKAIDDMLVQLVHEQTNRCDLAGHLASLFTTGEKAKTWEGIYRSVNLIRKQMDEFGERAEKAGDELEALKKSIMIPAAAGTMDYGSTVIISGQAEPVNVTFKAEQFNIVGGDGERIDLREYGVKVDGMGRVAMGPLEVKVRLSDDMRDAVMNAIVDDINGQSSVIMAAIRNK